MLNKIPPGSCITVILVYCLRLLELSPGLLQSVYCKVVFYSNLVFSVVCTPSTVLPLRSSLLCVVLAWTSLTFITLILYDLYFTHINHTNLLIFSYLFYCLILSSGSSKVFPSLSWWTSLFILILIFKLTV